MFVVEFTYQVGAPRNQDLLSPLVPALWMLAALAVVVILGLVLKWHFTKKHFREIFLRNRDTSHIVQNLSGQGFEQWVVQLLLSVGAKAKHRGQQGDHGIDVVAEYQGRRIGIQCKKYDKWLVGEPEVRDLYGVKWAEHFDKVMLITSGNFSLPALLWAKGKQDLVLVNQKLLERIILDRKILRDML